MNGSAADAVTIGMVLLAAAAARTATVPSVTIIIRTPSIHQRCSKFREPCGISVAYLRYQNEIAPLHVAVLG